MESRRLLAADLGASETPLLTPQADASIAGEVTLTANEHCGTDAGEGVGDVTLYLLNEVGERLQTTTTSSSGAYAFTGLAPGLYAVQQVQPAGLADAGMLLGSGGGQVITTNLLGEIEVATGAQLTGYRFCETHDPGVNEGELPQLERHDFLTEVAERRNVILQMPAVEPSAVSVATPLKSTDSPRRGLAGPNSILQREVTPARTSLTASELYGGASLRKPVKSPPGLLLDGAVWRSAVQRAHAIATDRLFETVDWQRAVIDQLLWFAPKSPTSEADSLPAEGDEQAESPVQMASLPEREPTQLEVDSDGADITDATTKPAP